MVTKVNLVLTAGGINKIFKGDLISPFFVIFICNSYMDLLNRQIIKRIIKEEVGMDKTLSRILEWYDSWETKLNAYLSTGDYAKIIDIHFRSGIFLFTTMKKFIKTNPKNETQLIEKFDLLRDKLIILRDSRKLIDSLK